MPTNDTSGIPRAVSLFGALRRLVARYGKTSAVAAVALATVVFVPLRDLLGREQWGWPYLLVVGFIAGTAGIGPALISAVLAFFAWNFFFFPPYHTLFLAQSSDIVHLLAFLVVAVAVGWQTGRLRDREEAALREERHLSVLNRLSARLVSNDSEESMARAVAEEAGSLLPGSDAIVWVTGPEGGLDAPRAPESWQRTPLEALALEAFRQIISCPDTGTPTTGWVEHDSDEAGFDTGPQGRMRVVSYALCVSGEAEGVMQILMPEGVDIVDEHQDATFASTAHVVAAFLRTRRLATVAMHAAAERETERLRSALVSSVSHELKTPLASITAAVTDLVDPEVSRSTEEFISTLKGLDGDLDRLDSAIADLLDASRLEARAWRPRPDDYAVGEVLGSVLAKLSGSNRRRVELDVGIDLPEVHVDFVQIARAIGHALDNAFAYSDGPVWIRGVRDEDERVLLRIEDRGPGISNADLPFVFDKFYRGSSGRESHSSTGLGLAITKEIVAANAGSIAIERVEPHGTSFVIALPAAGQTA